MDMLLKERLVGAVVLVLAAVIFIPVVLDGPDSNAKVTQSVVLPALGGDEERRTVRIDLDSGAAAETLPAVAVKEPASVDLTETRPAEEEVSPPEPVTTQAPATDPVPAKPLAAEEETGVAVQPWTVQVGSFSNDSNAENLAAALRERGFPAYVSRFEDGGAIHHRVRVGGFASRDAAQAKADEIREQTGQPARPARNR
ncbi:MAG TPA: SPOR domain-containing protein [Gammaproteobacteria bacterium]